MRFMIIVRAQPGHRGGCHAEGEAHCRNGDVPRGAGESRRAAGCLGAAAELKGWRIKFSGGERTVVDGPFTEAKELIAGYTIIQAKSKEEAMEWAKRFPAPHGEDQPGEIEIRQLFELEDFGPSEAVERFRDMGAATKK